MLNLKKYIKEEVSKLGINLDYIDIVHPPKEEMGDFALPCFTLNIGELKNPNEKANYIQQKLKLDSNIIEKTEVMGAYLNFYVNSSLFAKETIQEVLLKKENYGSSENGLGKNMLIEHTSINPNASPHIGRTRNSIIGDFLVRLYRFEGYTVEANYFINDIGKQIAMLLVGVEKFGNINTITFKEMLNLYIEINEMSKKDKSVEQQIFNYLHQLENGNKEIREKFKKITDICVQGQQEIFQKMDITWDCFTHESDFVYGNQIDNILKKLSKSGKLKEDSNGRLYVDLTVYNIPTKSPVLVLTREDKTSLYPLRDLAYTIFKIKKNGSHNVIVLGEDQEVYMKQIQATLDILGYPSPQLVSYDFVLLDGDKMATREGKVVLLEDFIEKAKQKILHSFQERGSTLSEEKLMSLAVSCIKYNMLNVRRKKTVNFNLEAATDFQGNSAIYLLYSYVRINSLLSKSNYQEKFNDYSFQYDLEHSLIKSLYDFPEIIKSTIQTSESLVLTTYLYNLCQKFSKYYETISILNEDNEQLKQSRLALLSSLKVVLENGMKILGIQPIDKI